MQVSDSRIEPKIDCRLFQMRGVVSVSYVLHVRVTSAEHFAETLNNDGCRTGTLSWNFDNKQWRLLP